MDIFQTLFLAILQGITEFLPISSSAHLILVPLLTDWSDQGLGFDIAVHLGTLSAVVYYFRRDLRHMASAWSHSVVSRQFTAESRLAWSVLLATIPVGLVGLLAKGLIEAHLRSVWVIAVATIVFGLLLGLAAYIGRGQRNAEDLRWRDVIIIGCAQALALIPGTSRSGITLTAGLLCGLNPQAAARFAFLLSIPVITLASGLQLLDWLNAADTVIDWQSVLIGMLCSALSAYLCIHYFLKLLNRIGLWPFVAYRLVLGAVLLIQFS